MDKVVETWRATTSDCELVTTIITRAFADDPLWSHAMARADGTSEHHKEIWRIFIEGALHNSWTWVAGSGEAASVWIPPGGVEMTPDEEEWLVDLAHEYLGDNVEDYLELLRRFEVARPRDEPHYYLSLLGTDPDHRGKGVGMTLLAHDLALIDAEGMPAYLESSSPANNDRYVSVGFEPVGEFSYPGGGPVVTTMWRSPR